MRMGEWAVVAAACALMAACSDPKPEIIPFDQVDVDVWRVALVRETGSSNPDMRAMSDVAVKDCDATVNQLALQFTLSGAHPEWTGINMTHVCPSRVGKVDQALKSNQDTEDDFRRICRTPPGQRTTDDQQLVDAVGPGACDPYT